MAGEIKGVRAARMGQLRGFVEWEKSANPGKIHIAEWALHEIERLRAQSEFYRQMRNANERKLAKPPSAPVGVEGQARKLYDRIFNAIAEDGSQQAEDECVQAIASALAQQPAAVDGAAIRYALEHARDLDDGVRRVLAVIAAQPGGVE